MQSRVASKEMILPIDALRNRDGSLDPDTPRRHSFLRTRELVFIAPRVLTPRDIHIIPPRRLLGPSDRILQAIKAPIRPFGGNTAPPRSCIAPFVARVGRRRGGAVGLAPDDSDEEGTETR